MYHRFLNNELPAQPDAAVLWHFLFWALSGMHGFLTPLRAGGFSWSPRLDDLLEGLFSQNVGLKWSSAPSTVDYRLRWGIEWRVLIKGDCCFTCVTKDKRTDPLGLTSPCPWRCLRCGWNHSTPLEDMTKCYVLLLISAPHMLTVSVSCAILILTRALSWAHT